MLNAESRDSERGQKEHTQEPRSFSGLENLIIARVHRYLPSDQTQAQLRNAGGNESSVDRNKKP